ncbi:unnamed protein product [Chrysoparadoxa australica]
MKAKRVKKQRSDGWAAHPKDVWSDVLGFLSISDGCSLTSASSTLLESRHAVKVTKLNAAGASRWMAGHLIRRLQAYPHLSHLVLTGGSLRGNLVGPLMSRLPPQLIVLQLDWCNASADGWRALVQMLSAPRLPKLQMVALSTMPSVGPNDLVQLLEPLRERAQWSAQCGKEQSVKMLKRIKLPAGAYQSLPEDLLKSLSDQGIAEAALELGTRAEDEAHPMHKKVDLTAAMKWHRIAKARGSLEAGCRLGVILLRGSNEFNITADTGRAVKYISWAAKRGHGWSQLMMARFSELAGQTHKANQWLHLSAERNIQEAVLLLADRYYHGSQGLKQDFATAYVLFKLAADKGGLPSTEPGARPSYGEPSLPLSEIIRLQCILGAMLYEGKGVEKDLVAAKHRLRSAARIGEGHVMGLESLYTLAMVLLMEKSEESHEEAFQLLHQAASLGHAKALELIWAIHAEAAAAQAQAQASSARGGHPMHLLSGTVGHS